MDGGAEIGLRCKTGRPQAAQKRKRMADGWIYHRPQARVK